MITYYVNKQVGGKIHTFTVTGKNLFECVMAAKKFSFDDVHTCGLCAGNNLELSAHATDDGYNYVYVRCKTCKATLNFGQQKKDNEIFYLKTIEIADGQYKGGKAYDWKAYVPEKK